MAEHYQPTFDDKHGFVKKPLPWNRPLVITGQEQADALAFLPMAQDACKPAPPDPVRKWISTLGALVAGNMPVGDARAKLSAYTRLLDVPLGVVDDDDSLKRAGHRFKWFPSYAELAQFVDEEKYQLDERVRRLQLIAEGPKPALARARQRLHPSPLGSVLKRDPSAPVLQERTDDLDRSQVAAYWTARMEGKTIDEAFAVATESSGRSLENVV
ncbi:MAG: hypothetical protein P4L94_24940 [Telmatospirillum sp.]|nr:hypothetical protein [Telmatospirillum sp.]